nr:hypothetical protein [Nonomuraea sp. WAC 01424]
MRSASRARLRVMVSSQAGTAPRRASYAAACRHARTNASWAISSASADSRTIVRARP